MFRVILIALLTCGNTIQGQNTSFKRIINITVSVKLGASDRCFLTKGYHDFGQLNKHLSR